MSYDISCAGLGGQYSLVDPAVEGTIEENVGVDEEKKAQAVPDK